MAPLSRVLLLKLLPKCSPSANIFLSRNKVFQKSAPDAITLQPPATPRYARAEFSIFNLQFTIKSQFLNSQNDVVIENYVIEIFIENLKLKIA